MTLCIDLFAPGMTPLHRAGAAGLWMTLEALEHHPAGREVRALGAWEREQHSVTLSWAEDGETFWRRLFEAAYPLSDGRIEFVALREGRPESALVTHAGMLATFLQHPQSRTAEKGGRSGALTADIDGTIIALQYQRVSDHRFRSAPFRPDRPGDVAGWLLPGAVVRHVGLGAATSLREPPDRLLALRFAPIGCVFFQVRHVSASGGGRLQYAVAIPELDDLEDFTLVRRSFGAASPRYLHTAGPGDAALRLLFADHGRATARDVRAHGCQVVAFGSVPWSAQQRTRVAVMATGPQSSGGESAYRAVRRGLQPEMRTGPNGTWWDVPQIPELAAENVLDGRPWWTGFADWMGDNVRRDHILWNERKGLHMIVKDDEALPDGAERAFVRACHEAWRHHLGQLGQRARDQGISFQILAGRERERLRTSLARSKTAADLRSVLTDFWARSAPVAELHRRWPELLPFIDERRWSAGRDLALLALASYGSDEEPQNPTAEIDT